MPKYTKITQNVYVNNAFTLLAGKKNDWLKMVTGSSF